MTISPRECHLNTPYYARVSYVAAVILAKWWPVKVYLGEREGRSIDSGATSPEINLNKIWQGPD